MDIYGMGVLIQGDSGIGKSETGLELVKRGHRLVADDRVDVFAKDEETLWGEPAEVLRHLLEIRGVGFIDIMSLYGASAVKDSPRKLHPITGKGYLELSQGMRRTVGWRFPPSATASHSGHNSVQFARR